jgi:hypothetical protein
MRRGYNLSTMISESYMISYVYDIDDVGREAPYADAVNCLYYYRDNEDNKCDIDYNIIDFEMAMKP